jgi:drug/metabolite transporter (DMT)-like permease
MKNIGIALIAIGVIMTLFTGFNLVTKKKVVDLGAVEISSDKKTPIYWSPITGAVIALTGILIYVTNRNKT